MAPDLGDLTTRLTQINGAVPVAASLFDYLGRCSWAFEGERWFHAASTIKRLLSISRPAIADLLADDSLHLGHTLRWAENLRGRTARSTERQPRPDRVPGGNDRT